MSSRGECAGERPPGFGGGTNGASTAHSPSARSDGHAHRPAIPTSPKRNTLQLACPERDFSVTQ